jgi:isopentenyl-diphosphate delta-isomerase
MLEQKVILVNEADEPVGVMEKMEAHRLGLLHRAFSVFIFDAAGRMLLQRRAAQKYHGGGLWTNACCSHPYPEEKEEAAAHRRIKEELGFTTQLQKIFSFTYKATVENGLIEHEYDHVFAGEYEGIIKPNEDEVSDYTYCTMDEIKELLQSHPRRFTEWFKIAFSQVESWWETTYAPAKVS